MRRAAIYLAALCLLWAFDAAFGWGVFWSHDLRHHHFPWRVWASGEWTAGRIPLWAPGVANGFPLMADGQTGVFYPPTMLLYSLLPAALAQNWSILLHQWWAGFGMFLFVRSLGCKELSSFLAAIGFAFSGFFVTHTLYLGMQNAIAWLPWLLWAITRRNWAMVAASGFALLVAGHPQAAVFSLMLGGAWAAWRRVLPGFAGASALSALGASPQLIASWELSKFSAREGGVSAAFGGIGSLPPQELINGVLPRFFGFDRPADVLQSYYHRGTGYWGAGENHWEMAFYLGIPVVLLALLGRRDRFWLGVALVSVLLMLGDHLPFWPLLRKLPVLDHFRFPVRFALWLTVAATVLAARGLDTLIVGGREVRQRTRVAWTAVGLVLLATMAGAHQLFQWQRSNLGDLLTGHFRAQVDRAPPPLPDDLPPLLRAALPDPPSENPALIPQKVTHILDSLDRSTRPLGTQVLLPVGLCLLLAWGLWLVERKRLGPYPFAIGVAVLLFVDLYAFGGNYHPRTSRRLVEAKPAPLSVIEQEPTRRWRTTVVDRRQDTQLDRDLMSSSLGLLWGTRDVIITSPLLLVRNEAALQLAGLDLGDKGPAKVQRLIDHKWVADLMGVRWLLTVHEIDHPGLNLVYDRQVKLYRNEQAIAPPLVLGCATRAADPWLGFLQLDPRRQVLVEEPTKVADCDDGRGAGRGWITDDLPQSLSLRVEARRDAVVVVPDSWYPGWQAEVDGESVPLLRADFLFRGVEVGPGTHEVVFRYRPWWRFTVGLVPLAWLGMVALSVWQRRGRGQIREE